jgi:hypothetical protein
MKKRIKNIIGNGLPWGLAFFVLSFILGFTFHLGLHKSLWVSMLTGMGALLVNGWMYSRFTKPVKALEALAVKLDPAESFIIQAPANHLVEDSLVSGKLFLTRQQILFKAYEEEDRLPLVYAWDLAHLEPVDFSGSLWNAGGEFVLKTREDVSLLFEVDELKPWREAFELQLVS